MPASFNPQPPMTYCARHMVAWCNDITIDCPYCTIEALTAKVEELSDHTYYIAWQAAERRIEELEEALKDESDA